MSDLRRARGRAEAFARALDDGPRHSPRRDDDRPFEDAVELVGRLRDAGAVMPRPEFTADLRRRLLEQAAARAVTTPAVLHTATATAAPTVAPAVTSDRPDEPSADANEQRPEDDRANSGDGADDGDGSGGDDDATVTDLAPRRRRRIRLITGTATLVLLGGGLGSAAVAQQAVPGDALYGMKRSIEDVSTTVGVGDASRGRRELEHAMTRLGEVRTLAAESGDAAAINATLADFGTQARRGVTLLVGSYQRDADPASITTVTTFLTTAGRTVSELAPALPPESLQSAAEALATIEQLTRQTATVCPACAKPTPAVGRPGDTVPRPLPTSQLTSQLTGGPPMTSPGTSGGPSSSTRPDTRPTTSGQPSSAPQRQPSRQASTGPTTGTSSRPPTGGGTTVSSAPRPTQPSTPTPSTPKLTLPFPLPLPTISLPPLLPTLGVPGLAKTILPVPPDR